MHKGTLLKFKELFTNPIPFFFVRIWIILYVIGFLYGKACTIATEVVQFLVVESVAVPRQVSRLPLPSMSGEQSHPA